MNHNIPLFYHSSSVLFLDDDPEILNGLSTSIDKKFPFILSENPQKALDYLKKHSLDTRDFSPAIIEENHDVTLQGTGNVETFDIDFAKLHGDLSASDRFGKVLVAVIDRHIPAFDGLEFCRVVKEEFQLPVKIILLTGATTLDEAIKAFNEKRIDAYIPKTPSLAPMADKMNQLINQLAWQQFYETSKNLAGLLVHKLKHISTPAFVDAFKDARESNDIVEFYLYDSAGSFLMFDALGNAKLFLVRSEQDFETMLSLAEDNEASDSVINDLKQRKQFPFAESRKSNLTLSDDQWDRAMVPMKKLDGSKVFYAVIPFSGPNKIINFDYYVNEIWANL